MGAHELEYEENEDWRSRAQDRQAVVLRDTRLVSRTYFLHAELCLNRTKTSGALLWRRRTEMSRKGEKVILHVNLLHIRAQNAHTIVQLSVTMGKCLLLDM